MFVGKEVWRQDLVMLVGQSRLDVLDELDRNARCSRAGIPKVAADASGLLICQTGSCGGHPVKTAPGDGRASVCSWAAVAFQKHFSVLC